MLNKNFTSINNWFRLKYPIHWSQYDEDDGSYLFMDNENWKGNLRISALKFELENEASPAKSVQKAVNDEFKKYETAKKVFINESIAVYYLKAIIDGGEEYLIHNWTFGIEEYLFIISYLTPLEAENIKDYERELFLVNKSLESIEII